MSYALTSVHTVPPLPPAASQHLGLVELLHTHDCIVAINRNGFIIGFDHVAESVFGVRRQDVLGKPLFEVITTTKYRTRQWAQLEYFLAASTASANGCRIELFAQHADGLVVPAELTVVPFGVLDQQVFAACIRSKLASAVGHEQLQNAALRYRQVVELSPEAILVCRNGELLLANQAASRLLDAETEQLVAGKRILDFVDPEFHALFDESLAIANATGFQEQIWLRADGSRLNVEIGVSSLLFDSAPALQIVVRDISARKRAEALQLGQNRILNMVATGAPLTDVLVEIAHFVEQYSDRGLCSILQLASDGTTLYRRIAPSLPSPYLAQLGVARVGPGNCSCGTAAFRGEPVMVTDISTDPLWESRRALALEHSLRACTSWPIFGTNKKMLGTFALYFREPVAPSAADLELFGVCTKLAGIAIERHASEERIRHLAHYDGLTGLANRFLFKEYLEFALRNAQRRGKQFAVLFLDLDKFKEINDTLGHDAGDRVLREVAARLRGCLRDTDKIARMGGDEFYVLIEDLNDGRHAGEVARKLVAEAARPIQIGSQSCQVSASVGIALFPQDGTDGKTLLRNADSAMYEAKEAGRNAFRFHSFKQGRPASALAMLLEARTDCQTADLLQG